MNARLTLSIESAVGWGKKVFASAEGASEQKSAVARFINAGELFVYNESISNDFMEHKR